MISKTTLSVPERRSETPEMPGFRGLVDIAAACVPLAVLGTIGARLGADTALGSIVINLAYVLCIVVASVMLRLRGTGWREIGLARPKSWPRTVFLGIGALVGAILVMNVVQGIALNLSGLEMAPPDISRFNPMTGNLPLLLIMMVAAWTTIAFGEEMFYRAFLISRLGEVFHHTKVGWALAVMGSSVAFGLVHYAEGPLGLVTNGAFGLLFGLIYLATGRNLWVTIIAHGLLNTLRFLFLFIGAA